MLDDVKMSLDEIIKQSQIRKTDSSRSHGRTGRRVVVPVMRRASSPKQRVVQRVLVPRKPKSTKVVYVNVKKHHDDEEEMYDDDEEEEDGLDQFEIPQNVQKVMLRRPKMMKETRIVPVSYAPIQKRVVLGRNRKPLSERIERKIPMSERVAFNKPIAERVEMKKTNAPPPLVEDRAMRAKNDRFRNALFANYSHNDADRFEPHTSGMQKDTGMTKKGRGFADNFRL